ncbi:MAG: right-handed parallel beta-helix repeat-containing protein [Flavobacteriales bacterium]|nr:right-handed parallel beta-helix repeat-containing protein [Flavobacteriales bacterium]MBK7940296.1 right-handed parallel beta-helix repeat-containing protein [Flavobacteriales bacterium]MBK9699544.1 right-handed parallel beta-helix repeat-containing protein [Flavobacteriales bacterium]
MRNRTLHLVLPVLLLLALKLPAATYHVSPGGNDTNSGTSPAQAWQTIARVNQIAGQLQPGDQVLFQRGGVFRGKLTVSASGTAGNRITIGAYGTGADPVISGSVPVTGWTVHSGQIWRAPFSQAMKQLFVNGALQTLARYPNSGWLRNDLGTATTTQDAALTQPAGYWTGATMVMRTTNWSYDTARVTAHSGTTLTHTSTGNNIGDDHWGYFLRNKLSELDAPGEWFHDVVNGQLYLWCPGNADPNTQLVEVSVTDHGISISWQRHHILVEHIAFRHQTGASLRLSGTTQLEADHCSFSDTYQAILSTGGDQDFHHLNVQRTYATGVYLMDDNSSVTQCVFEDVALQPGLGENNWGYFGLRLTGQGMVVTDNRFDNIGYVGMVVERNALVERNVVRHALAILNDGGGIAFDNADGMIIRDNIVMDITGNLESSAPNFSNYEPICHGIYFGNISIKNTLVQHNTVANCLGSGIHVDHTMVSTGNQIKDNILFNNTVQLSISDFSNSNGPGATAPYHMPAFNDVYSGNVMYALAEDQLCMRQYHVYSANWVDYGTFNNNYYFNPYNDRSILQFNTFAGVMKYFSLERWQAERGEDANSLRSPKTMSAFAVADVLSANLVPNGNFAYDVNGWSGWPSQGQTTHDYGQLDNGALKVHFANNNTYNEFTLKHNQLANVQSGQWYRFRFSIQSTMQGEVKAGFKGLTQQTGPQMVASRFIPFSPVRRDVTMFFQSDLTDQGNCTFTNHYTESTYWLDNVELHRVDVTPLDPLDRQQLLVNDQPTAQTFSLDGCWSDVQGNLHSGSITVQAYRSIVLVREEDILCGLSTGIAPDEQMGADRPMAFPNPVEAGGLLHLTGTGSADLRLMDLSGRMVWQDRVNTTSPLPVPSTVRPGTYVLSVDDGSTRTEQKLMVR